MITDHKGGSFFIFNLHCLLKKKNKKKKAVQNNYFLINCIRNETKEMVGDVEYTNSISADG